METEGLPLLWREEIRRAGRKALLRALRRTSGDCTRAAAELGIHRNTLARLLREHGLPTGWELRRELRMPMPPEVVKAMLREKASVAVP